MAYYEPIDAQSADLARKNKIMKAVKWIGGGAVVIIVVMLVFHPFGGSSSSKSSSAGTSDGGQPIDPGAAEASFSGLLMDNKGFYFPLSTGGAPRRPPPAARRRHLRSLLDATPTVDDDSVTELIDEVTTDKGTWAVDWSKDKAKDLAAIGEYYKAKADALKNATNWSDDWKANDKKGEALGVLYATIGKAIDDHYKEAFATTATTTTTDTTDGDNAADTTTTEEPAAAESPATKLTYDWMADRDRGIAIGQYYKNLHQTIADHYASIKSPDPTWDYGDDWEKYKAEGIELGEFYKKKGEEIEAYYAGKIPDDPNTSELDPNTLNEKGTSIEEYYRAVLDPNYAKMVAAEKAKAASGGQDDPQQAVQTVDGITYTSLDDVNAHFEPWGVDKEEDNKHSATIKVYWHQRGKAIGNYYKTYGKALGKYYHDYYHGLFDTPVPGPPPPPSADDTTAAAPPPPPPAEPVPSTP